MLLPKKRMEYEASILFDIIADRENYSYYTNNIRIIL